MPIPGNLFLAEFSSEFNSHGFPTDINLRGSCHSAERRFWSNNGETDNHRSESANDGISINEPDIDRRSQLQIVDMADDCERDGTDSLGHDALPCCSNSSLPIFTWEIQ